MCCKSPTLQPPTNANASAKIRTRCNCACHAPDICCPNRYRGLQKLCTMRFFRSYKVFTKRTKFLQIVQSFCKRQNSVSFSVQSFLKTPFLVKSLELYQAKTSTTLVNYNNLFVSRVFAYFREFKTLKTTLVFHWKYWWPWKGPSPLSNSIVVSKRESQQSDYFFFAK